MTWSEIGLFVGLIFTFLLGIINWRSNRRNLETTKFIDTITAERIKWLEKLRQDISKFAGLTHFWTFSIDKPDSEEARKVMNEIDILRYLIKLRLNPEGEYDKKIMNLIDEIPNLAAQIEKTPLKTALSELIKVSQKLLKEEWNRVKKESKKGSEVSAGKDMK